MMTLIVYVFLKLQAAKEFVRPISKKHCFKTPFDSQQVKSSQKLMKSAWEHFYHIFHHSGGNWVGKCLC